MQLCRAHFSSLAIYDEGRLRMINKTPGIYIYLLTEKINDFFVPGKITTYQKTILTLIFVSTIYEITQV
jgi:hypothetical protein